MDDKEVLSVRSSPSSSEELSSSSEDDLSTTSISLESVYHSQADKNHRKQKENVAAFTLSKAPSMTTMIETTSKRTGPEPLHEDCANKAKGGSAIENPIVEKEEIDSRKRKSSVDEYTTSIAAGALPCGDSPAGPCYSRRVRRTPKEAVELEQRRVWQEIAAAREHLASQKAESSKKGREDANVDTVSSDKTAHNAQASEGIALSNVSTHMTAAASRMGRPTPINVTQVQRDGHPHSQPAEKKPSLETTNASQVPVVKSQSTKALASSSGDSLGATRQGTPSKQPSTAMDSSKMKSRTKKQSFDEQVLSHMQLSFKPFTLKTLAQELNSTETIVNFSMLSMVDKNLVIKKDFPSANGNKVRSLYWVNYGASTKELATAFQATGEEVRAVREALLEANKQRSEINRELAATLEKASNDDLAQKLNQEQSQLDIMTKQLEDVQDRIRSHKKPTAQLALFGRNIQPKTAAELAREKCPRRLKIRINKMRNEWKARKSKCTAFVDTLADCMEKRPKDVIQLLELETDEMMGVTLPPKQIVDDFC